MPQKIELIATCPMGLEAIVAREIRDLGYTEMTVENGRVRFFGDELGHLSRQSLVAYGGSVLVLMGQFKATTFDELFEGTKALAWPDWIPNDAEFPVEGVPISHSFPAFLPAKASPKKLSLRS